MGSSSLALAPVIGAQSLNHWTTWKVPCFYFLRSFLFPVFPIIFFFYHKWVLNLLKFFFIYWNGISFLLGYTYGCLLWLIFNVKSTLCSEEKMHLVWCIILCIYCVIWFCEELTASMLLGDTGLIFFLLHVYLSLVFRTTVLLKMCWEVFPPSLFSESLCRITILFFFFFPLLFGCMLNFPNQGSKSRVLTTGLSGLPGKP